MSIATRQVREGERFVNIGVKILLVSTPSWHIGCPPRWLGSSLVASWGWHQQVCIVEKSWNFALKSRFRDFKLRLMTRDF